MQSPLPVSPHAIPKFSLSRQLSLLTIVSTVALALILSVAAGVISTAFLRYDVAQDFETRARRLMERLDHEIYERWHELEIIAHGQTFVRPDVSSVQQRALLEAMQETSPIYAWIGFTDTHGIIQASTYGLLEGEDVSNRLWYINGRRAPYIGDLHAASLLEKLLPHSDEVPLRFLDVSVPVYRDGVWVGVLGGHLSWAWLSEMVRTFNAEDSAILPENRTEAFIISGDGYVIMDTLPDTPLSDEPYPLNQRNLALPEGSLSTSGTLRWLDGKTYITGIAQSSGYSDFPGFGYRLILRQFEGEALAPARALQQSLIQLGVGLAVLFSIVNFFFVRSLLAPLKRMAAAVTRIQSGEAGVVIPTDSPDDEVGLLGRVLNKSFATLNQHNADLKALNESLERRVEERTSAAERRTQELANEIAARKQLEAALTDSRESFRRITDSGLDGIAISVDGVIIYSNKALFTLFGYEQFELIRMTETEFVAPESRHIVQDIFSIGDERLHEVIGVRKDGRRFPVEISGRTVRYSGTMSHVMTMRDISGRKRTEAEIQSLYMLGQKRLEDVQKLNETLEYRSSHDHLTNLANRQALEHHLQTVLNNAPLSGRGVAVIFIDLDHFKEVNDLLGHSAGDMLLQMVANRMRAGTEKINGLLARMGGDEFAVVVPMVESRAEAVAVAETLMTAVSDEGYNLRGRDVKITASIGISFYPEHGHTVENLLRKADIALYNAKDGGRNTYRQADDSAEVDLLAQMQLEIDLRGALERRQLEVHYQPQFTLHDDRIMGFEALLRWNHPTLGSIPPSRFIPVAEASDLILTIGAWVMNQATLQAKTWRDLGYPVNVSVNVSPRQFESPEFVASVKAALAASGIPASSLELEVTEGLLIRDIETKSAILEELATHGVRIAIDDFGTGFSSLSYLQKLPINTLKIDQSFIANIRDDDQTAKSTATAIIRAVSQMAHSLGIMVVAEGVETALQISVLRLLEADALQGYLLGRPVAPSEAFKMLEQSNPQTAPR